MTNYKIAKEKARQEAIDWQNNFIFATYSFNELLEWENHFNKLAQRYGLLREFRENGII